MKNNLINITTIGAVVLSVVAAVSGQTQTIKVVLGPEVSHATSGAQIRLTITKTNVGTNPVVVGGNLDLDGSHAENNYSYGDIVVLGPKGGPAPLTAFGQFWRHSIPTGSGGIFPTITAGESISETLVLSRIFDLTMPGTYTVKLSTPRRTSNEVRIIVER